MPTYWLIAAAETSRAAAFASSAGDPRAGAKHHQQLDKALAEVFPGQIVLVRDFLSGYRPYDGLAILLVEVQPTRRRKGAPNSGPFYSPGIYIVKIGVGKRAEDLKRELDAWNNARPPHLRSDNMFVSLDPFPPHGHGEPPMALVYGDASAVLGSQNVLSLEEAIVRACKFGQPKPQSIVRLFRALYERLGTHFFRRSAVFEPASYLADAAQPRLSDLLWHWHEPRGAGHPHPIEGAPPALAPARIEERRRLRRETLALLSAEYAYYSDPVDYFTGVWQLRDATPPVAPALRRGFAHGDMHARNIQVSLVNDEISQCAVFDYEQMRSDNFIAWDFIKMEVELAVRMLNTEGHAQRAQFVDDALTFWRFIAVRTDEYDRHSAVGPDDDIEAVDAKNLLPVDPQLAKKVLELPKPLFRLAGGIVNLRRLARKYLGGEWLRQYDFLLAWYACRAGLYENYEPRMVTAALIAAGVSARRMMEPFSPAPTPDRATGEMSHRPRFLYARAQARSGEPAKRDEGVERLKELCREYPHVLEIDEELALGYIEQKDYQAAEQLLNSIPLKYQHTTAEYPSRMGSLWKQRGLAEQPHNAYALRESLAWYRRAEAIRGEYFPAINVATLLWLLGENAAAKQQAEHVIELLKAIDPLKDPFWPWATRGEAMLLLGDKTDEAIGCYRRAVAERDCLPRDRASMRRQLEWLRPHLAAEAIAKLTDDVLKLIFS
jgi:tetratricopeptide (TPR) repeat protein